MKTDNAQLAEIIGLCYDYSMDGRLSPAQQTDFLVVGKRLRGSLLNLLSASFKDGTKDVVDANQMLKKQNQELANSAQLLNNATTILKDLTLLVGVLDGLLKLAAGLK